MTIVINERVIADHMAKLKKQKRVPIDEEALRWTPLVQSGMCNNYIVHSLKVIEASILNHVPLYCSRYNATDICSR